MRGKHKPEIVSVLRPNLAPRADLGRPLRPQLLDIPHQWDPVLMRQRLGAKGGSGRVDCLGAAATNAPLRCTRPTVVRSFRGFAACQVSVCSSTFACNQILENKCGRKL